MGISSISCSVSKNTSDQTSSGSKPDDSPRILFLNYEITRDSVNSTYTARLINTIQADGSLKKDRTPLIKAVTGDLELQVLNANQHVLTTLYISNPLDKSVEFVNDAGELQQQMVSLERAQFSVRMQVVPGAHSTLLKRISGPDSEDTFLLKTPIL